MKELFKAVADAALDKTPPSYGRTANILVIAQITESKSPLFAAEVQTRDGKSTFTFDRVVRATPAAALEALADSIRACPGFEPDPA